MVIYCIALVRIVSKKRTTNKRCKERFPNIERGSVSVVDKLSIKRRRSEEEISILFDSLFGTLFSQTISLLQSDPGTLRRHIGGSYVARQCTNSR